MLRLRKPSSLVRNLGSGLVLERRNDEHGHGWRCRVRHRIWRTQLRRWAVIRPTIPVARPRLPSAAHIAPYLAEIDANGWYSNFGPLSSRFQARRAMHWGLAKPEVALFASGTAALTLALLASGAKPGSRCLMPSWTFAASAGAVHAAGLVPHFIDIDPGTWALDPANATLLASGLMPGTRSTGRPGCPS